MHTTTTIVTYLNEVRQLDLLLLSAACQVIECLDARLDPKPEQRDRYARGL